MEDDLKNTENGISLYQLWLWVLSRKFEENSEEISSVALLSPACFYYIREVINLQSYFLKPKLIVDAKYVPQSSDFLHLWLLWDQNNVFKLSILQDIYDYRLFSP